MRNSAQCENEKFDIDLQQRMDEQTPNKNILQKLSGIHKLDKASKVYKGLATADVEVRNFKKIRFSPVKLKVILRIVKRGTKRASYNAI
jgi:hypothetical protein